MVRVLIFDVSVLPYCYALLLHISKTEQSRLPDMMFEASPAFRLNYIQTDCVFKEVAEISCRKPDQQIRYCWHRKRFVQLK